MNEITRKSVLLECLEYERGIMRLCSEDHQGRLPAKGEEDLFFDQQKKCKIIEELIQALDSEPVRRTLADWQKDVMKNGPTVMELEGLPKRNRSDWIKGEWPKEPEVRFYEG